MNDPDPMPSDMSDASKQLEQFVRLKSVLFEMEESLGLEGLSDREIRVLCALVQLRGQKAEGEGVGTDEVREHIWCKDMTLPTFYRALKSLNDRGVINRGPRVGKSQQYTIAM